MVGHRRAARARRIVFAAATAAVAGSAATVAPRFADATTYTYVGPFTGGTAAGNFWSNASSWSTGTVPVSATTTQLVFPNFDNNGYATINNVSTGGFLLNNLTVNSFGNGSQGLQVYSVAGSFLEFGGVNPTITVGGPGNGVSIGLVLGGTTSSVGIQLDQTTTINGGGNGTAFFGSTTAAITGAGGLIFAETGLGAITLNGTNTFTGGVTLNSGSLAITTAAALGASTNTLTINGGNVRLSTATITNNVVLNADLFQVQNTGATLAGIVSGTGGVRVSGGVNPTGTVADNLTLSGVDTYAGATRIDGSAVFPNGSGNVGTLTLSGSANNSSGVSVGLGGTLAFTGSSNNTRFGDAAPVSLAGGRLTVSGLTAGAAFNETFGALAASGENTFAYTAPGGANVTSTLAFGTPTLSDHATLFFRGAFLGSGSTTGTGQVTFTGGLTNVSDPLAATPGVGQATGVVPFAAGATSDTATIPSAFVTYNASGGVQLLPVTNATYVNQSSGTGITAAMAHLNVNLLGTANASSATALGINASQTVNALSTSSTQYLAGNGTITVNSGAVLTGAALTLAGPTLDFGSATGYVHLGGTLTLANVATQSQITGSGGVVFSGALGYTSGGANRTVLFSNAATGNPFTGGLTLNNVAATFNDDGELGASGGGITLDGGSLQQSTTVTALATNRPIRLGAAGGGATAIGGGTLTLGGNITGPGAFSAIAVTASTPAAVVALTGFNTYAGGTFIQNETLNVAAGTSLGTGPVTLLGSGTLQFSAPTTLSQAVNFLAGGQSVDTNGSDVVLAGQVTGATTSQILTKVGVGTLSLTANDAQLSSGLTVSAGTLALSGNGAIPQVLQTFVAGGAEFRVDNSGTNLPDRVADLASFILPATSTLHLIGNAAAASSETVGSLNLSSGAVNLSVDGPTATLTSTGFVSGPGSIAKAGTGTMVLAPSHGPNTFSGGLAVAAGTVRIASPTALSFGSTVLTTTTFSVDNTQAPTMATVTTTPAAVGSTTVNGGGTLDLGGQTLTEPVTLNGGSLLNSAATAATLTSGVKGSPIASGGEGYQPTDAVFTTGGTGAVATVSLGLTSDSFNASSNTHPFQAGVLQGKVTIFGGGGTGATALVLANQTDENGDGSIRAITITNPGMGYTSAPSFNISDGGTIYTFTGTTTGFTIVGTNQAVAGTGYVPGATSTINTATGSGAAFGTVAVSSLALSATSSIGGVGDLTVQPAITGGGGLAKVGADNVFLTATGSYSGGTTVSAGTLRANATAATGTAAVLVAAGGTLGGNGSVGAVSVAGTITAGPDAATVGTFNTGSEMWNAGGGLLTKVNAAGTASDLLVLSGLTVNATNTAGGKFGITVTSPGAPTLAANGFIVLADDTEGGSANPFNSSLPASAASLAALGAPAVTGLQSATGTFALSTQADTTGNGGYDLILVDGTAAAPEPTSLLLAGAAAASLVLGRHRRVTAHA